LKLCEAEFLFFGELLSLKL